MPSKCITINDKDPVWMDENIKSKIKTRNLLYKQYIQNGGIENDFLLLEIFIIEFNELIPFTKSLHYENLEKIYNRLLQAKN